jgi:hypothetical protein
MAVAQGRRTLARTAEAHGDLSAIRRVRREVRKPAPFSGPENGRPAGAAKNRGQKGRKTNAIDSGRKAAQLL